MLVKEGCLSVVSIMGTQNGTPAGTLIQVNNYNEYNPLLSDGEVNTGQGNGTPNGTEAGRPRDACGTILNKVTKERYIEVVNVWNKFASQHGLSRVMVGCESDKKRMSHLAARFREDHWNIESLLAKIEKIDALRGKGNGGWRVDFDFIVSPSYIRILEGKYDTWGKSNGDGSSPEYEEL